MCIHHTSKWHHTVLIRSRRLKSKLSTQCEKTPLSPKDCLDGGMVEGLTPAVAISPPRSCGRAAVWLRESFSRMTVLVRLDWPRATSAPYFRTILQITPLIIIRRCIGWSLASGASAFRPLPQDAPRDHDSAGRASYDLILP